MADKLIPKQALDYIKNKKLHPAFSYKDVWNEEHATAFTVPKAMQLDVLSDIKGAVEKAIEKGTTFEQFKKELKPTLMQKGWWGKREMTDPLTGETITTQLGSDRRLKTIYSTNLRSAYQKGQYDRTMESDLHPYLMYRLGASVHHREQHLRWNNIIRPKDDPIWNSIFPPNGYGCLCYTVAVTQARKEKYEHDGVPAYNPDTQKTVRVPVQTTAPKPNYKNYFNERKGTLERIPEGIMPGFNWNQGQIGRNFSLLQTTSLKASTLNDENNKAFLKTLFDNKIQRESFRNFVDSAFNGNHRGTEIAPVGFLDRNICKWLKEHENIDVGVDNIIGLESRLIKGIKASRHKITKDDADIILDALLYGHTYWATDPHGNKNKSSVVFLMPVDENNWLKIAVRPVEVVNGISSAFIRSVGYLSNESVKNELNGKFLKEIK